MRSSARSAAMLISLLPRRCLSSSSSSSSGVHIPRVLGQMLQQDLLASDVRAVTPCSSSDDATAVTRRAAQKTAIVYDEDALTESFRAVKAAFPPHFVHALAIKSSPLAFIVREAIRSGLGIEAASFGELASAVRNGARASAYCSIPRQRPWKSWRWALDAGVSINADSLDELERIDAIMGTLSTPSTSMIGLRVNPILSGGKIAMFSVSRPDSKFGHALHDQASRAEVIDAFARYEWLCGLHCHVGSAGTSLPMLAEGAATLAELADEIDAACAGASGEFGEPRITAIDIGGGLASSLESDVVTPTFAEYARCLHEAAPSLFAKTSRTVFTEFGRALLAKTGWIVSQVEYVKRLPEAAAPAADEPLDEQPRRIATCHAGADLMLRQCYTPTLPSSANRVSAYDARGEPIGARRGPPVMQHIAGPLCFAGDYPRRGVRLPPLEPGDFLVFRDTGANTIGLWSRHCSRLAPPAYTYRGGSPDAGVTLRKPGETLEKLLDFWE